MEDFNRIHDLLKYIQNSIIYRKISNHNYIFFLFIVTILTSPFLFWPNKIKPSPDAWFYLTGGLNISKFGKYLDSGLLPIVNRGPVLPFLLSLPISFFKNSSPETASLLIIIVNTLGMILIIYLGEKYFNRGTGFIAFVLIASSKYFQEWLFLRVMTDMLQSFLIILGLIFTLIAIRQKRWFYYIFLGIILGLGFLTKESTFLWLPFPIILWLLDTKKITSKEIVFNLLFLFAFIITILPWFIYVFKATGEIYLLGRFNLQIYYIQGLIKEYLWLMLIIVGIFIIILVFYLSSSRKSASLINRIKLVKIKTIRRLAYLMIFLYLFLTFTPVFPKQIINFIWQQVIPIFPIYLAILSWVYYFFQSNKKKTIISKWIFLIIIFSIPTILIVSKWNVQPRNLILFMLISYVLIANAGIELIKDLLRRIGKIEYSNIILLITFLLYFVYALGSNISLSKKRSSVNPFWLPASGSSKWIEKNVNKGNNILMSWWSRDELYFSTKGEYPLIPIYPEKAELWDSIDLNYSSKKLFTNTNHLAGEKPIMISLADPNPDRSNNFLVIYPSQIESKINETKAKYIIISGNHKLSPLGLSLYLDCNPDTNLVYEVNQHGNGIKIFEIANKFRSFDDCPTVLDAATLKRILEDSKENAVYVDDYQILKLLGKKIVLYPETDVENLEMYLLMGKTYGLNNDGQSALNAFRNAADIDVKTTFNTIENIKNSYQDNIVFQTIYADLLIRRANIVEAVNLLRKTTDTNPNIAFSHYVYGQALKRSGETDQAIIEIEKAIQLAPEEIDYSIFLSNLYASKNEFQIAYQILNEIRESNPKSASNLKEISMLNANYFASIGETQKARNLYNQFNSISNESHEGNNTIFQQFAPMVKSRMDVDTNSLIYRDVFFQIPAKEIIYMHPPSNMTFDMFVPEDAELEFSIALSSSAWSGSYGDGVDFSVFLDNGESKDLLWSKYINPKTKLGDRRWFDVKIDLQQWAHKKISIIFETSPGPENNSEYDWAGWGEPRIVVPTQYEFLAVENFNKSIKSQEDQALIHEGEITIDHESRNVLFEHPTNSVTYTVNLADNSELRFGIGMDPSVWSPDKGDGVGFNIYISQKDMPGVWRRVFYQYLDPKNNPDDRHWKDFSVDLHQYSGQDVKIIFETDPGPNGNSDYDWAGWSEPVIITGVGNDNELAGAAP